MANKNISKLIIKFFEFLLFMERMTFIAVFKEMYSIVINNIHRQITQRLFIFIYYNTAVPLRNHLA